MIYHMGSIISIPSTSFVLIADHTWLYQFCLSTTIPWVRRCPSTSTIVSNLSVDDGNYLFTHAL